MRCSRDVTLDDIDTISHDMTDSIICTIVKIVNI